MTAEERSILWRHVSVWAVLLTVSVFAHTHVELANEARRGETVPYGRVFAIEVCSHLVVAALLPVLYWMHRRWSIRGGARTVRLTEQNGNLRIEPTTGRIGVRAQEELSKTVAHMFRLDEDLSGFYGVACDDSDLAWCAYGAGRMLRAPTVFEDVVKTT